MQSQTFLNPLDLALGLSEYPYSIFLFIFVTCLVDIEGLFYIERSTLFRALYGQTFSPAFVPCGSDILYYTGGNTRSHLQPLKLWLLEGFKSRNLNLRSLLYDEQVNRPGRSRRPGAGRSDPFARWFY